MNTVFQSSFSVVQYMYHTLFNLKPMKCKEKVSSWMQILPEIYCTNEYNLDFQNLIFLKLKRKSNSLLSDTALCK